MTAARLGEWLVATVPGWQSSTVTVERIGAGWSNLTFRIRGAAGHEDLVLRRAPDGARTGHGAHDMRREHRVLAALHGTPVPVPRPVAYCDDATVVGAPFHLMAHVEGAVVRQPGDLPWLDAPAMRGMLGGCVVDRLADLHLVEATTLPIHDPARVADYGPRQLRSFRERFIAATDDPSLAARGAWLFDWLLERCAPPQRTSVLHNDFKLDNLVLAPDAPLTVRAVLDWEMATVGDPLFDLGMTLGYWVEPHDPVGVQGVAYPIGVGPQALSRAAVVARYAERTGLTVDARWCEVLGLSRVAVIGLQLHAGWRRGALADRRFAALGALAAALVARAEGVAREG